MKHEKNTEGRDYAGILMAGIKPRDAQKWARASAEQRAWESYVIAARKVYRGIPLQDFCAKERPQPLVTDLTMTYENEGTKIVRERLQQAGVRLAAILEADLGGK